MARVLMVSLLFPPDNVSTAHLMGEVCEDLRAHGHQVVVISTTPHYNRDPEAEGVQPLRPHWGRLVQASTYRGMTVYHTLMPPKGASRVGRVLAWGLFHVLSVAVAVFAVGRVDVLMAPSPPLTMGLACWVIGLVKRAPFIYSVLELHPDIAINLGMVKQPLVIRMLYGLERFVYARAAHLTVIAEAMRTRVLAKGVPPRKVTLVPNFVDTSVPLAVPRPNAFSREYGLDGLFVVSYAGNVGPAQGLEGLLEAATLLRDDPRARIVIVGGGILWKTLAERISAERLDNVRLLPHQSFEVVPLIYGASDLCVVAQAPGTASDAVPSKIYRIMGAAKPVLAMTVPSSDLATLVQDSGCGAVVSAADPGDIVAVIRDAMAEPEAWRARGEAGRAHVETHYSRRAVTARYIDLVNQLAGGRA